MNKSERNIRIAVGARLNAWEAGQMARLPDDFDEATLLAEAQKLEDNNPAKFAVFLDIAQRIAYPELR